MDTKKRRNSILKKPLTNEDDTTGDVTTKIKRRISFSGKKSVKEFIAGEEEATIWGTSYEESADGLQASSVESGLVNVHEKRLILRNRRVVFEANPKTKRRSKKKVNVAENDKENIYVPQPDTQVQVDQSEKSLPSTPVIVMEPGISPEAGVSEKSDDKDGKIESASDRLERLNICSNTLDFINFSATTSKSISIEQSVDVSLSESELQMFKFRQPVTAMDHSPDLSIRDSLSPNIFSQSILMSEEDAQMLKLLREKKKANEMNISALGEQALRNKTITQSFSMETEGTKESESKKRMTVHMNQSMAVVQSTTDVRKEQTIIDAMEMDTSTVGMEHEPEDGGDHCMDITMASSLPSADGKKRFTMHLNQTMNVTQCGKAEGNRLKRKTITKTVTMDIAALSTLDVSFDDFNSPLRKKPMPNTTDNLMEITSLNAESVLQQDSAKERTIHFESAAVEESTIYPEDLEISLDIPPPSQKTVIFDHNQIREDSICRSNPGETVAGHNLSMELSVCEPIDKEQDPVIAEKKLSTHCRTLHVEDQMDLSLFTTEHEAIPQACEAPPETTKSKSRESIYTPAEIDLESPKATMSRNFTSKPIINATKERQSIYVASDMVEDSPKATVALEDNRSNRQTLFEAVDIEPENRPVNEMKLDKRKRESVYTATDMIEDSPKPSIAVESQRISRTSRQTLFEAMDIAQEDPSPSNVSKTDKNKRASVYAPVDIVEDSPKSSQASESLRINYSSRPDNIGMESEKVSRSNRQTIFEPVDIDTENRPPSQLKMSESKRESVYVAADMIEDSPKSLRTTESLIGNCSSRQISLLPNQLDKNRESVYTPADIVEDSPKHAEDVKRVCNPNRQTLFEPVDIEQEDLQSNQLKKPKKKNKSIYIAADMIENSPESMIQHRAVNTFHDIRKERQSIYTATDMVEESPKPPKAVVQEENIGKPISKVIVKHMNLQQGILGDPLTTKFMQNHKIPDPESTTHPERVLKASLIPKPVDPANKPNFRKLNEDLLHGRTKAFAEDRMGKPSLFDRLENNPTEEIKFNSFKTKSAAVDFMIPSVKTSMKDYTMDLPSRNANAMDLSFGDSSKQPQTFLNCDSKNVSQDVQQKSSNSLLKNSGQQTSNRKTIHFHEDNDLDVSTTHTTRQENQFNQPQCLPQEDSMELSMAVAPASPEHKSRRQTIHSNDDIQEEPLPMQPNRNQAFSTAHDAMDLTRNEKPEADVSLMDLSNVITYPPLGQSRGPTIHMDLETTSKIQPNTLNRNRKTLYLNQDLETDQTTQGHLPLQCMSNSQAISNSSKLSRQTIHFHPEEKLDETAIAPSQNDSAMNLSIVAEPEIHTKPLPKPRRLTVLDDQPVEIEVSPQKFNIRKSSFSRTLNFNQIQNSEQMSAKSAKVYVNDDSPLYLPKTRAKSPEITTDINRSLAEYLKVEAAARSCLTNPLNMSVEVAEAVPNIEEKDEKQMSKTKRQTTYESVNVFEESGMQPLEQLSLRRQKSFGSERIMETEKECDKSMEFSPLSTRTENPTQTRPTSLRKTIHFASENAVDESFFDEMVPKEPASKRQTIFFNEPKNPTGDMDITLEVNKTKSVCQSKAVQSMKEILQESNLLFTQAEQFKDYIPDTKRSTMFFSDPADSAMDLSTVNTDMDCDLECTPTRSKLSKSRIPQLIGSAKKLQSIKKSMEFIQQELPYLAVQRDETPPRHEQAKIITPRKKQVTLDNMPDLASVGLSKLQESFEMVNSPRRTSTHAPPRQLQESFDTVDIPRRAAISQRNETLNPCLNETTTSQVLRKSGFNFDNEPITISDVSTFFTQKPLLQVSANHQKTNETYSPNTTEALCNLDLNRFTEENNMPRSSDSEDTVHNFDKFKQRYLELTCDNILLSEMKEDIDKTHLSLVNTLDEASEVVLPPEPPQPSGVDSMPQESTPPVEPSETPVEPLKPVSSVCRKCKRNPLNGTQNDTTIGSFVLEPLPEYTMNLAALRELQIKPKITDVGKVWRKKMRESDSFSISDGSRSLVLDDNDSLEDFIAALDKERLRVAQQRQRKEVKRETSFVNKIRIRMQSKKSDWLLNELLIPGNILKFTHARIRTFAILISFTPKDPRAIEVVFDEIKLIPNSLHTRHWTAFEYALHYQLFVELPFDLRKLCPTPENLFQLLEHVDEVTKDVLKVGKDMLHLVLSSPASLIREPSGSLYIRKIARIKTPQNEVKLTEFQIEVRNIKKLSYESIIVPPLYEFDEKIQLLPVGQDFLRVFLADPMKYVRT